MFNRSGNLSVSVGFMPNIVIEQTALEKMKAYVTYCDKEIGWLGTATQQGNTITIHDMFLFEQEVHETTCEINEQAVAKWYEEMLITHENGIEIVNTMRVWGHSHVNMSVSPSGQDDTQFSELIKGVNDFFIRIIANKKGEMRLDYHDVVDNITFYNIEWATEVSIDLKEIQKEITQKVKKKVYVQAIPKTTHYSSKTVSKTGINPSWYDEYYEDYSTYKDDKFEGNGYYTWEDVLTGEELICDYGFDEEAMYDISRMSVKQIIEYMDKYFGDSYVIEDEAEHLKDLCTTYLNERYGVK